MMIRPKEITKDEEGNIHIASFNYNDGIEYAKINNIPQTSKFNEYIKGTHFIVCCGDVMIVVGENDFPKVARKTLN